VRKCMLLVGVVAMMGMAGCEHARRVNERDAYVPPAPDGPTLGQAPIQTVPEAGYPGPAAPMPDDEVVLTGVDRQLPDEPMGED
jgi:hypothetical protein